MTWTKAALLVPLSACVTLVGCQTLLTRSGATDTAAISKAPFCSVADPITYSKNDTTDTQKQVREHNAVGVALCNWGPKP